MWVVLSAVVTAVASGSALAGAPGRAQARPATVSGSAECPPGDWIMWYERPAARWTEALPVGNGHIGAMVYGGAPLEQIQFNEHTVWTGRPRSYAHAGAAQFLPQIRQLLFEGKQREAERLAGEQFMSVPLRQMAYQPCGDLWVELPRHTAVSSYRRWLDLDSAMVMTEYRIGDVTYRREVFAS